MAAEMPLLTRPVQDLRVRLWGVQGSCPAFPTPESIHEHSRRLAVETLGRALSDLAGRGRASVEELLGGPPTPENLAAYQRRLGLPHLPLYGGETTCLEVETAEGDILLFDAGSGLRRASIDIAQRLQHRPNPTLHLFGSHEHLDHRSGLSFARFCYARDNPCTIHVYAGHAFLHTLDRHYGIFSRKVDEETYLDDPIDYTMMPARFVGTELRPDDQPAAPQAPPWAVQSVAQPIRIGRTTVTAFQAYHVGSCCLGYKVEHNGKRFIFCTDHELRRGPDPGDPRQARSQAFERRLRQLAQDADLAYFDGQYFLEEYLGKKALGSFPPMARIDWGHGCIEDALERAAVCNIKHTLIGHHDPERTWPQRHELAEHLVRLSAGRPHTVQLADSDQGFDL